MAPEKHGLGEPVTQGPTGSAMLHAERLRVGFPTRSGRIEVLSEVSFALARGTWTTCLGPFGCGKTTLLRVLAGLGEAGHHPALPHTAPSCLRGDGSLRFQ